MSKNDAIMHKDSVSNISVNNKITLVQFGQNTIGAAMSARYLSGILRNHGYKVTIICVELSKKKGSGQSWDYRYYDLSDGAIKTIFELSEGSLFIGVTVYSFVAHIAKKIYLSSYNSSKIPFVAGGAYATLEPYATSHFSDYVCVGDGEKAIVELAHKIIQGDIVADNILSVAENIYNSCVLRQSTDQPVLCGIPSSIDSRSMLDYSLESEYCVFENRYEKVTKENAGKYISLYATFFSRGCVNNCSFCGHEMLAQKSGFQKRIKAKEVTSFVNELKTIKANHSWANRVAFFDPNILSNNRDSLKTILNEYRLNVKLPLLITGFTFNQINEDLFHEFLKAGMTNVIYGIESGAEKTRMLYNRRESKAQILKIDTLNWKFKQEYDIHIQYDIITDSPWENVHDTLESLTFIAQLKGYDFLDIFSLRFLPGTKLFQKAIDDGFLKRKDVEMENQKVYHSIARTYENFVLLLLRDGFLRYGLFFRIAVSGPITNVMRKFFAQFGERIFRIYSSKPALIIVVYVKKINKLFRFFKRYGLRHTFFLVLHKVTK